METEQILGKIEAILFSQGTSVEIAKIAGTLGISEKEAKEYIQQMMREYESDRHGIHIVRFGDKYQLCTKPEYYEIIKRIIKTPKRISLTDIQFEVLAMIAYKQPVTRAEIDGIRGADSYRVIMELIGYGLVEECGRIEKRGYPIVYGTTEDFLRRFALSSIDDLPPFDIERMDDMEMEAEREVDKLTSRK